MNNSRDIFANNINDLSTSKKRLETVERRLFWCGVVMQVSYIC